MTNGFEVEASKAESEVTDVETAEATFCLRLAEARIYLAHLKSLRNIWSVFAILSWLLTLGALTMVLWPYLGGGLPFEIPPVISYVSAFVVVIAAVFALIASYRVVIAVGLVSHATMQIDRARAVERIFGTNPSPEQYK
jgi:hypothetical protein